jgi:ribonucleoside-diphosphate reductase alpha chain
MPNNATTADIRSAYVDAWKMGLKCVAIYRDGSKRSQPLNTKRTTEGGDKSDAAGTPEQVKTLECRIAQLETELVALRESAQHPIRRRLPDTRMAVNHKFDVAGHEGYLTVGLFDNGQPGELFVTMAKEGSTIGGLMDSVGALTSMSLQYGVPLEALVKKFAHQRFEPSGFTRNPDIRQASSIIDYVFRWMACQFVEGYRAANSPNGGQAELPMPGLLEELKKKVNRPVPISKRCCPCCWPGWRRRPIRPRRRTGWMACWRDCRPARNSLRCCAPIRAWLACSAIWWASRRCWPKRWPVIRRCSM